jgi:PAS domain S-box-containing protein
LEEVESKSDMVEDRIVVSANVRTRAKKRFFLTHNTDDVIIIVNNQGFIQHIHRTVPPYTVEAAEGKTVYEYVPVEQHDVLREALRRTIETGSPCSYEVSTATSEAGTLWFRTKVSPIIDHEKVEGAILICTDISERKKAAETLRKSEVKYRTLVENLSQKIFLKDRNSVYVSCNEKYARDLKITSDEIAGKTDYDFYPKKLAEKYKADDKKIMDSGKSESIEEEHIQDGQKAFVQTVKTPVKDENGNVVGVLGIFWDITERKKAEAERELLLHNLNERCK